MSAFDAKRGKTGMRVSGPVVMNHAKLCSLLEVRTRVGFTVKGSGNSWVLVVHAGGRETVLSSARGEPRRFRRFETLAGYLRLLDVTAFRVDISEFTPSVHRDSPPDRRSVAASDRMRRAHRALAQSSASPKVKSARK